MRFVADCCHDITNIEADRMELKDEKLLVYNRGRLVYSIQPRAAGVHGGSGPDHAGEADGGEG